MYVLPDVLGPTASASPSHQMMYDSHTGGPEEVIHCKYHYTRSTLHLLSTMKLQKARVLYTDASGL